MKKKLLILSMAFCVMATACGQETKEVSLGDMQETEQVQEETSDSSGEAEEAVQEVEEAVEAEAAHGIGYITWSDYHNESTEDYNTLITTSNGHIDVFTEGYDALNNSLTAYNKNSEKNAADFIENNLEDAKELLAAMDYSMYYTYESDETVYRADTKVLSFFNTESIFLGGAHPSTYIKGYNYDSQTGQELSLKDVITDYDKLFEITKEKLANHENSEGYFEEYETTVSDMFYGTGEYQLSPPEFCLTVDGMIVMFNQYEIAPYATGYTMIDITKEEYPELFNVKYIYDGEGRIQAGDDYEPVFIDIDGDSKEVSADVVANENDEYSFKFTVNIGDVSSSFDYYGFGADWSVLTDRDGQSYMYVATRQENDYVVLVVLKLTKNGAEEVGEISGLYSDKYSTDPYNMVMYERMEALGSFMGGKVYHITESGMPATDDKEYNIRMGSTGWYNGLETKEEIVVYVDGEELSVPAGTVFSVRETDNQSYVRAVMEDGRECEIRYTVEDGYIRKINGTISEYDAFEMLPYAG